MASTTRDLDTEAREGRFRRDLLRRFSGCRITVPPIRQRPADLPAIVEQLAVAAGRPRSFTQAAMTVLAALPWAENFDELEGVMAAVLAASGPIVTQEDVLAHAPIDGAFTRLDLTATLREAKRRFERDYIAAVLERHRWRMSDGGAHARHRARQSLPQDAPARHHPSAARGPSAVSAERDGQIKMESFAVACTRLESRP